MVQIQLFLLEYLTNKFLFFLDEDIKNIGKLLFDTIIQSGRKLVKLLNNICPKIIAKADVLKEQLKDAWKAAEEVSTYIKKYNESKKLNESTKKENEIMKIKIKSPKKENQKLIQKLLYNSKFNITSPKTDSKTNININLNSIVTNFDNNNINSHKINKNNSNKLFYISNKTNLKDSFINYSHIKHNSYNNIHDAYKNDNKILYNIKSPKNIRKNQNLLNPKILTIKMAKDIMNEIYNSKVNYDKKCFENKVPIETLEQHMYTYLNQKYGLKNLIIERAASIIN